jgi:hypothetical protein
VIVEKRVLAAIAAKFGLPEGFAQHELVKEADEAVLAAEVRDCLTDAHRQHWIIDCEPLETGIIPWTEVYARETYLQYFERLSRGRETQRKVALCQ